MRTLRIKERIGKLTERVRPVMDFLKIVIESLNPDAYHEFTTRSMSFSLMYLASMVFIIWCIACMLSVPRMGELPNLIESKISNFNEFKIDIVMRTNQTVGLPFDIQIDSEGKSQLGKQSVLITSDKVYIKKKECLIPALCSFRNSTEQYSEHSLSDFEDIVEKRDLFTKLVTVWIVNLLPLVFIIGFLYLVIKFLFIVTGLSALSYLVCSSVRYRIKPAAIFKIAVYASTILIVATIPGYVFHIRTFFIPELVFLIYTVIGIMLIGEK